MNLDGHIKYFNNAKDLWAFYNKLDVKLSMKQAIIMWSKLKKEAN